MGIVLRYFAGSMFISFNYENSCIYLFTVVWLLWLLSNQRALHNIGDRGYFHT